MPKEGWKMKYVIFLFVLGIVCGSDSAADVRCTDECGTEVTPQVRAYTNELLRNGSWDQARLRTMPERGAETQFVKITVHIVRYSNGTGGLPESRVITAIGDLNAHVVQTGLVFFQNSVTNFIDSDQFAEIEDSTEFYALIQTDDVPGTVNIYFVPSHYACGSSTMPGNPYDGIVMANDCTATSWNHSTFSHEVGHYFGLYHTHNTSQGAECVSGSNCATAGDFICDTSADPNVSGVVNDSCVYTGTATDICGSGNPYTPSIINLMNYAPKWCRYEFTQEQSSIFLTTAETYHADHLVEYMTGACCNEDDTCVQVQENQCINQDWNWQGLGTTCDNGCVQNAPGACCVGTSGGCIDNFQESTCLAGNGEWLGPYTSCGDGGCELTCKGDADNSGVVDVNDLLMIIDDWGMPDSPADVTGDNLVDVNDILLVVSAWGVCP
jgi:hypothetical protein